MLTSHGPDAATTARRRVPGLLSIRQYLVLAAAIVATAALVLWLMGQVPICKCGYVKAWHGVVRSAENSQHLSDWYTFTHVIHGFAFYGLLSLVGRGRPVALRLMLAVALESAWEVFENTDLIINRYRTATISLDYYGDSVINSVTDILAMATGFYLAWRLPALAIVLLTIGVELLLAYSIRDNLTLNILMLVHPIDSIRQWQMGA
jgi:hypothetical protein